MVVWILFYSRQYNIFQSVSRAMHRTVDKEDIMYKKVIGILIVCLILLGVAVLVPACGKEKEKTLVPTVIPTADSMDTKVGVSALVALEDNHVSSYANALDALAMTQEVQSGNWEEMKGLLAQVEKAQVPGTMWFVLPDGSYYTVALDKTDKNLSDRAYFPGLMSGKKVLGSVVFSKSTGKKSLIAASPVVKDGNVIGGLGASIFLDDLSKTLVKELELPDNMVFYATTDTGEVVLNSDTALIILENPDLPENVVFATSPLTGWRFALGFKD